MDCADYMDYCEEYEPSPARNGVCRHYMLWCGPDDCPHAREDGPDQAGPRYVARYQDERRAVPVDEPPSGPRPVTAHDVRRMLDELRDDVSSGFAGQAARADAAERAAERAASEIAEVRRVAEGTERAVGEVAGEVGGVKASVERAELAVAELSGASGSLRELVDMLRHGDAFVRKVGDFDPPERGSSPDRP